MVIEYEDNIHIIYVYIQGGPVKCYHIVLMRTYPKFLFTDFQQKHQINIWQQRFLPFCLWFSQWQVLYRVEVSSLCWLIESRYPSFIHNITTLAKELRIIILQCCCQSFALSFRGKKLLCNTCRYLAICTSNTFLDSDEWTNSQHCKTLNPAW